MIYAVIENGIVSNVISLLDYNSSDFPDAVKLGDIAVAIGDSYVDGEFFRNGEKLLTLEEQYEYMKGILNQIMEVYEDGENDTEPVT